MRTIYFKGLILGVSIAISCQGAGAQSVTLSEKETNAFASMLEERAFSDVLLEMTLEELLILREALLQESRDSVYEIFGVATKLAACEETHGEGSPSCAALRTKLDELKEQSERRRAEIRRVSEEIRKRMIARFKKENGEGN